MNVSIIASSPVLKSSGSSFLPSDVSGLLLWLRAESLNSLANGDPISSWNDSSGNGYNATQTGSRRPTKQTVSGFSVARFDGTDDALVNTSMPAIGTGNTTFYVVATINNNNTIFNIGNGTGANMLINRWGGNAYVNPQGSGSSVTDGSITAGALVLVRVRKSGSTVYVLRQGATEASGSLSINTNAGYVLGDYFSSSAGQPIDADIYEVILYNSDISSSDRSNVENYLVSKYAIP